MKMRLITGAQIKEVEGSYHEIMSQGNNPMPIDMGEPFSMTHIEFHKELVKGRRYQRMTEYGEIETFLVGFDEQTARVLEALPTKELEEFEKQIERLEKQRRHWKIMAEQIDKNYMELLWRFQQMEQMNLWERLKLAWKGFGE